MKFNENKKIFLSPQKAATLCKYLPALRKGKLYYCQLEGQWYRIGHLLSQGYYLEKLDCQLVN